MLASQTHALRASEIRKRLAELAPVEEMNDELRSEIGTLRVEYTDVEAKYQAAVTAEDTPTETRSDDAEGREIRNLIVDANIGTIFEAALEHRSTDGREAEIQKHFGLGANQVPLAMLETRAVTPAPSNVGQNQSAIIPAVFPMSCAAFLGIDMPTVPVGEAVFPVLTTCATVATPGEGASVTQESFQLGILLQGILHVVVEVDAVPEEPFHPRALDRIVQREWKAMGCSFRTCFRRPGCKRRSSTLARTAPGSPAWMRRCG